VLRLRRGFCAKRTYNAALCYNSFGLFFPGVSFCSCGSGRLFVFFLPLKTCGELVELSIQLKEKKQCAVCGKDYKKHDRKKQRRAGGQRGAGAFIFPGLTDGISPT